jgi:hypothetical protein
MWYLLIAYGACQDADGDLLPSVLDALNEVQIKEFALVFEMLPLVWIFFLSRRQMFARMMACRVKI